MPRRIPAKVWQAIRRRAEAGENMKRLAEEYDVKQDTIHRRSKLDKWDTPTRRRMAGERITISEYDDTSMARSGAPQPIRPGGNASGSGKPDPAAVQTLVGDHLERAMLDSLPLIRATDSPRELITYLEAWRRTRGLDGRGPAPGALRLHAPRSIGRPVATRPPTPQGFAIE